MLVKIYTKTGDAGETGLFNGDRVRKDHLRIETYGTIDELNSWLGMVAAEAGRVAEAGEILELVLTLQHQLFDLGSDLATPVGGKNEGKIGRMGEERAKFLEGRIDWATERVTPLRRFVLPGGSELSGRLHVARTVCRRAERLLVTLMETEDVGTAGLIYLNRLSDLLFVLARLANNVVGVRDVEWEQGK